MMVHYYKPCRVVNLVQDPNFPITTALPSTCGAKTFTFRVSDPEHILRESRTGTGGGHTVHPARAMM